MAKPESVIAQYLAYKVLPSGPSKGNQKRIGSHFLNTMKKTLAFLLLSVLPLTVSAQTVKGPVEIKYFFTDNNTPGTIDYFEFCLLDPSQVCERIVDTSTAQNTVSFSKTYESNLPNRIAVRACNAVGCSGLSNNIPLPAIVNGTPNAPTNLTITINIVVSQ